MPRCDGGKERKHSDKDGRTVDIVKGQLKDAQITVMQDVVSHIVQKRTGEPVVEGETVTDGRLGEGGEMQAIGCNGESGVVNAVGLTTEQDSGVLQELHDRRHLVGVPVAGAVSQDGT